MAFNDIRIARIPDDVFEKIKDLAKKDRIHIHQKALQLIELGLCVKTPKELLMDSAHILSDKEVKGLAKKYSKKFNKK